MAIAPQTETAQPALDLGAVRPVRFLHFLPINGQYYIDAFGDRIFVVEQTIVRDRACWRASIRKKGEPFAFTRRFFRERSDAQDFLEAEARRLGGAA